MTWLDRFDAWVDGHEPEVAWLILCVFGGAFAALIVVGILGGHD